MVANFIVRDIDYVAELRRLLLLDLDIHGLSTEAFLLLTEHLDEFKHVLSPASKNTAHRKEVESGNIQLDDIQCKLNKDFIDNALQLADLFEIDELFAAEYLHLGSQYTGIYDRNVLNTAIYIYCTTREIYLDILRTVFTQLEALVADEIVGEDAMRFIDVLSEGHSDLAQMFFEHIQWIEGKAAQLEIGEKREKLLGSALLTDDRIFIDSSLSDQHEAVCYTISTLVHIRPFEASVIKQSISRLQSIELWDNYTSHRLISVILSIQGLALAALDVKFEHKFATDIQVKTFREVFQLLRPSIHWKCCSMLSVLQLVLSSELSGLCRSVSELADQFDYEQEILLIAKSAVKSNVFQHLITFFLFTQRDVTLSHPFSIFFTPDSLQHYRSSLSDHGSDVTPSVLNSCLRQLTVSLIVNLADLLKEIHLNAEDQMLSQEVLEGTTSDEIDHSEDLFFGLIYTAYSFDADLALPFWEDRQGNLYGFMVWASHAETPSTVYAYFKMMTALVKGPACSAASIGFFDPNDSEPQEERISMPSETSSWTFMFDSFRYYIGQLDKRTGSGLQDSAELDPQNALILESYVSLICGVLSYTGDLALLSTINTKFEALSLCFQLLSQQLPAELYSALFKLISVFAASHDMQKTIWQLLEAWLGAINLDVQAALLTSTPRSRQIEHRPLNSLTTFVLISPTSTADLIDCLSALLETTGTEVYALPFPVSLGDNTRYPGVSDYVDFVKQCFTSSQSPSTDIDVIQRIRITASCLRFFERGLSSLELTLIGISRFPANRQELLENSLSVQDYLSMHAGTRVLHHARSSEYRDKILNVVKSHAATDHVVKVMLWPAIASAVRVSTLILNKTDIYDEFVAPLKPAIAITRGSLAMDIAHDPSTLIHIALLCSTTDPGCIRAAVAFLEACDKAMLFGMQQFITLCSTDESKTILLGLIHLIEGQEQDLLTARLDLMNIILSDLKKHTTEHTSLSFSHFVLGFTTSHGDSMLLAGSESGQVGSGRSMLHTLLHLLERSTKREQNTRLSDGVLEVATSIILLLCESQKTASIVLPILRAEQFLETQLDQQLSIHRESLAVSDVQDLLRLSSTWSLSFARRRSAFMRYCAKEILACKDKSLHTSEAVYTKALFPLMGNATSYGVVLFDWLDILNVEHVKPGKKMNWQYFRPETYLPFLDEISEDSLRQLQLVLATSKTKLLDKPNSAANKPKIDAEYQALLEQLSNHIYNVLFSKAIYECMNEWALLTAVIFDTLLKPGQAERRFSGDLVQALLIKLPTLQESDHDLADVLSESVSTLMRSTEHLEVASFYSIFKTTLACLQNPASTQIQREHLYVTGVTCLQSIQRLSPQRSYDAQLANLCKSGVDRLLTVICQDAGMQEDVLRITACAFLDLLLKTCEDPATLFLSQRIVRLNLLTRFAYQFEVSLQGQNHPEALSRQFDLVLRLAMTRIGARDLVRNRSLLVALAEKFFKLEDGTEDVSNAMRLLSVYIACVVAMGLQTSVSQALLKDFHSTWSEKLSGHARRMKKAANTKYEEFDSMLQLLSTLQIANGSVN